MKPEAIKQGKPSDSIGSGVDVQRLVLRFPLGSSIPLEQLPISSGTLAQLRHQGWTETGNFIEDDDWILKRVLYPRQYDELKSVMGNLKAEYSKQNV